jgi:transcriptional antiterminator RfaH
MRVGGPRWYVAQLKPQGYAVARRNLERQGFNCLMPMMPGTAKARGGKVVSRLRPLFPGYLFVEFDLAVNGWQAIRSTLGVSRLVTGPDGAPGPMAEGAIRELLARIDENEVIQPPQDLTVGDTVKVLSGPFADWVARIERLPEKDRVVLMFEMMGREVAVGVDVGNLQRA